MPARRRASLVTAPEEELVQLASASDPDAFRELARRHRRLIDAACASVITSASEREDAVQVALLDIWRGLRTFEGNASLTTWMYRVSRNAAVRTATRRRGRGEIPTDQLPDQGGIGDGWDDASSTRDVVIAVLERLPADQREALLLHTQAGVPLKEIAVIKMAAEGTVKSWIHRARAEIARELALG